MKMIKKKIANIKERRRKYQDMAKKAIIKVWPEIKPIVKKALAMALANELEKLRREYEID